MGRPPALTPEQQAEVRVRLAAGEGLRDLAREFGVGSATIGRLSAHSAQVRKVAETMAAAQTALAALPVAHQHDAMTLASKLRSISMSLANAAELGAATAHRLHELANSQACKIDDSDPMSSLPAMQGVKALTEIANGAASISLNLLSANREAVQRLASQEKADEPPPVRRRLSLADWKKEHGLA